ncbi:MAG: tRNA lysidine(34) synthetase TilS [Ruminococcaceae bacterium]|nr:tRNA lysidine(34) synthetase TilS [Oscillospiraceae bacterium]
MINKIKAFAEKYDMLPKGVILAAVSGGADSMCLLSVLYELSETMGFKLEAVHYNHRLRGAESDRDEAFVKEQCELLGIPCHIGSGNVSLWAMENNVGLEEAGRKLRYDFFNKTAERVGAERIATAHNADDNCETVIMNMTRGAGLRGLCGIPPRRDMIVRPILCVTRAEIEEYLTENNIPHVEDSTNSSDDYTRNRLRHHVLPVLRELNPRLANTVSNMTETLAEDREFLESLAESFVSEHTENNTVSVSALAALPKAVAVRVIRSLSGSSLTREQTEAVLSVIKSEAPSGRVSLPGCRAVREYNTLRFVTECEVPTFEPFAIYDGFFGHIPALDMSIRCKKAIYTEIIHKSFNSLVFKRSGLCGTIIVRPRAVGDKLTIAGRNVTKSIKKLMIEKRIPPSEREIVPIVCDEKGVIGAFGMGQDPGTVPNVGDEVFIITIS